MRSRCRRDRASVSTSYVEDGSARREAKSALHLVSGSAVVVPCPEPELDFLPQTREEALPPVGLSGSVPLGRECRFRRETTASPGERDRQRSAWLPAVGLLDRTVPSPSERAVGVSGTAVSARNRHWAQGGFRLWRRLPSGPLSQAIAGTSRGPSTRLRGDPSSF
jgi:hypothetical protein